MDFIRDFFGWDFLALWLPVLLAVAGIIVTIVAPHSTTGKVVWCVGILTLAILATYVIHQQQRHSQIEASRSLEEQRKRLVFELTGGDSYGYLWAQVLQQPGSKTKLMLWARNDTDFILQNPITTVSPPFATNPNDPKYASIGWRPLKSMPPHSQAATGIFVEPANQYRVEVTAPNGSVVEMLTIFWDLTQSATIRKPNGTEETIRGAIE